MGFASPQDEHGITFLAKALNDLISERLPAQLSMRVSHGLANGQNHIKHQHALACPRGETTCRWDWAALVRVEPLEDARQGRWERRPGTDGETQTISLTGAVVRVLPDNHDSCLDERSQLERPEDVLSRWKHGSALFLQAPTEPPPERLVETIAEASPPIARQEPFSIEQHGFPV